MTNTINELIARKSMRSYTGEKISAEAKKAILQAACEAPTAGNQQLYTILDITDQELKNKLVDTCDHQPMIAQADVVLIFCADCKKWYDAYIATGCNPRLPGEGDLMLAVCDTVIAAQNAVTAAWSMGIGSCYIGDIMENCEQQRELLKLPKYVMPVGMVIFGYPDEQQRNRIKPQRADLQFVVHENEYKPLSDEQLEQMWTPRCGSKSYVEWMQAFCNRKYNSDFSKEMTRSVRAWLEQFK